MKTVNDRFTAARFVPVAVVLVAASLGGCHAEYVTPGGPANLQGITRADIKEAFESQPSATFPAHLVCVRVQAPGYTSYTSEGIGRGNFSVVTVRDVEAPTQMDRLAKLPMVAGLGTLNRLVLPQELRSVDDLRLAAARLHADILLLYTFDTRFDVEGMGEPLSVVTLGIAPNKMARVDTTASAALIDVRSGFIYGLTEASASRQQLANAWTSKDAVDQSRRRAEAEAFEKLTGELEVAWKDLADRYANKATSR